MITDITQAARALADHPQTRISCRAGDATLQAQAVATQAEGESILDALYRVILEDARKSFGESAARHAEHFGANLPAYREEIESAMARDLA